MQTTKATTRRLHDPAFTTRYFCGAGIDIGSGPDPLTKFQPHFPRIVSIMSWDAPQGDATTMEGIADDSFDFVYSSHCLEHLHDPTLALRNWWRILKPEGFLILLLPDEDLYEQGVWPSTFNPDHKVSFTIWKEPASSWSPVSRNLIDELVRLPGGKIHRIHLLDDTYRFGCERFDQTRDALPEAGIEAVIQKLRHS